MRAAPAATSSSIAPSSSRMLRLTVQRALPILGRPVFAPHSSTARHGTITTAAVAKEVADKPDTQHAASFASSAAPAAAAIGTPYNALSVGG